MMISIPYEQLYENLPDGITIQDRDFTIIYQNKSMKAIFGARTGEKCYSVYEKRDEICEGCGVRKVFETGRSHMVLRTAFAADGSTAYWENSCYPMMDDENNIVAGVEVCRDVSGRITLETDVKDRNIELGQLNRELKRYTNELETFSYSVSHDLRTPLRSIEGFSQAILDDYADRLDEQGRDYFNRICRATNKMSQLIDDILKLSRLSRREMNHERVDMSSLARASLERLQADEPARKIESVIQDGMTAQGDRKLMEIMWDNLIGNAWKYTARKERPVIECGSVTNDGETVFFIRDNGAGFDMTYSGKLFTPFQRFHSECDFPGSGIGLTIVSRIVERHGGRIWAESEVGKGSTFYLTLVQSHEDSSGRPRSY
ncbi:MAG: ATP-binding protein [Vulcanimicrobiota bacterium]